MGGAHRGVLDSRFLGESDAGEEDEGSVLDGISFWPWDLFGHKLKKYELNLCSNFKGANHR